MHIFCYYAMLAILIILVIMLLEPLEGEGKPLAR